MKKPKLNDKIVEETPKINWKEMHQCPMCRIWFKGFQCPECSRGE